MGYSSTSRDNAGYIEIQRLRVSLELVDYPGLRPPLLVEEGLGVVAAETIVTN